MMLTRETPLNKKSDINNNVLSPRPATEPSQANLIGEIRRF